MCKRTRWEIGLLLVFPLYAQSKAVEIENAEELGGTPERRVLQGGVRLRQDTLTLLCQEAILTVDGAFTALGTTQTIVGQSGIIHAERLWYDPQSKRLAYEGGVRAYFPPAELRAPRIQYDRTSQLLYYESEGTLRDTTGIIYSERGYYSIPEEKAYFGGRVRLYKQSSYGLSDSLIYDVQRYTAIFPTPLVVYDTLRHDTLYAKKATWNRLTGEIFLSDSVAYRDSLHWGTMEVAYIVPSKDSVEGYCRVRYALRGKKGFGWGDTVRWHHDTLTVWDNAALYWEDSVQTVFLQAKWIEGKGTLVVAVGDVELLRPPLLAKAETLIYDTLRQFVWLRENVWLADSAMQLWADKLDLKLSYNRPDTGWAEGEVKLLIEADTFLRFFHQVKGDSALAVWDKEGHLRHLFFHHRVQTVYYQSKGIYWEGGHYALGSELYIELDSLQHPIYVKLSEKPQGRFWPIRTILRDPLWIKGMQWLWAHQQPRWPFKKREE
ncbi:MAG: OstA-like protein [Bacteroidia bacterium]|nr:hypothetical protein [Bacteroidia bacterium]MDW8134506.1 OstA-like protein [Bacteroidia bacterium]